MWIAIIVLSILLSLSLFLLFKLVSAYDKQIRYVKEIHLVLEKNFFIWQDLLKRRDEFAVDEDVRLIYGATEMLFNLAVECLSNAGEISEDEEKESEETD